MSTESTGAAEPGTAAAEPSEPPAAPPAPEAAPEPPATPPTVPAPETPEAPEAPAEVPTEAPAAQVEAEAAEAAEAADAPESSEVEVLESGAEPTRPRRKAKFGTLLLAAVVAGPLLGAGIGYGIQASRPETPLPPITANRLAYPAERVDAKALAAVAPKPLNIDGDIRELLVKMPDGAKDLTDNHSDGGWLTVADIAEMYGESKEQFEELLLSGYRRGAFVSWQSGDADYRVQLFQYAPDSVSGAISRMNPYTAKTSVSKIPGNEDSIVLVRTEPLNYARSTEQYYYGEALARKGSLVMSVEVHAKNPVDKAQLEDLAKRQWERIA